MDRAKMTGQDEVAYVAEKQVEADEEGEDGDGVGVVVACDEGKGTVGEKGVGIETEGHELMEGTVDVVDENRMVSVVEY